MKRPNVLITLLLLVSFAGLSNAQTDSPTKTPTKGPTTRPTKKPSPSPTRAPTRIIAASYNEKDWKNLTVLFRPWQLSDLSGYVGALFFVFVLGVLVELVNYCFARYDEYAVKNSPAFASKNNRFTIGQQMVRGSFKTLNAVIYISLMLICTTGDVGLIIMTALGAGCGFACISTSYLSSSSPLVTAKALVNPYLEQIKKVSRSTPLLSYFVAVCTLSMVVYSGVANWSTLYGKPKPIGDTNAMTKFFDNSWHYYDKQFMGFWFLPVALVMLATAFMDSQSSFNDIEGSRAPNVMSTQSALWVKKPHFGGWKWSKGQVFMTFLLLSLNILQFNGYFWSRMEFKGPWKPMVIWKRYEYVCRGLGYAGSWNVASAFIMYARNQIFARFWGVHYGISLPWHKWLGAFAFVLYTIHGILAVYMYGAYPSKSWNLKVKILPWESGRGFENTMGIISWFCMLFFVLGALEIVRRRKYTIFIWSHQLWMPMVLFALFHAKVNAYLWVGPLVFVIFDKLSMKLLRPYLENEGTITRLSDNIVRIVAESASFKKLPAYAPGSHVYVTVPSISGFNRHPFTIATYWPEDPERIVLFARARGTGSWTSALLAKAAPKSTVRLQLSVDGYFGAKPAHYLNYSSLVFFAGGTGLAAVIPLIKHYVNTASGKIQLIWSVRSMGDVEAFSWFLAQLDEESKLRDVDVRIYISNGKLPSSIGSRSAPTINPLNGSNGFQGSAPQVIPSGGSFTSALEIKASPTAVQASVVRAADNGVTVIEAQSSSDWYAWGKQLLKALDPHFILAALMVFSLICGFVTFKKTIPLDSINAKICAESKYMTHWRYYVPCNFWYFSGPLVVPLFFATFLGGAFLFIWAIVYKRLHAHKRWQQGMPPSVACRVIEDVSSILSRRVTCVEGRADVKAILCEVDRNRRSEDKEKEEVAVLAAGPEPLVLEVEKVTMDYATMNFYRESMEV